MDPRNVRVVLGIDPGQNGAQATVLCSHDGGFGSITTSLAPWVVTKTKKPRGKTVVRGEWDARQTHQVLALAYARSMADMLPGEPTDSPWIHVFLESPAMGMKAGIVSGWWRAAIGFFELECPGSIQVHMVPSMRWKRALGLSGRSKIHTKGGEAAQESDAERKAGKKEAIELCQRLFPGVSLLRTPRSRMPDDNIAEAVLIAHYGRCLLLGKDPIA